MKIKLLMFIVLSLSVFSCNNSYEFDNAKLTKDENKIMSKLIGSISQSDQNSYNNLYLAWKLKWKDESMVFCGTLACLVSTNEYRSLLVFCDQKGTKIWPLIFRTYLEETDRKDAAGALLEKTTIKYNDILNEIRAQNTGDDIYVLYIKELLPKFNTKKGVI